MKNPSKKSGLVHFHYQVYASEGNLWLEQFLNTQIGIPDQVHKPTRLHESMVMQDFCTDITHFDDSIVISRPNPDGSVSGSRDKVQTSTRFQNGTAKWFHLPQSTFSKV